MPPHLYGATNLLQIDLGNTTGTVLNILPVILFALAQRWLVWGCRRAR